MQESVRSNCGFKQMICNEDLDEMIFVGGEGINAVHCVRTVQKLSAKFSWFKPAVLDIRMFRIEESNGLIIALDDDNE